MLDSFHWLDSEKDVAIVKKGIINNTFVKNAKETYDIVKKTQKKHKRNAIIKKLKRDAKVEKLQYKKKP